MRLVLSFEKVKNYFSVSGTWTATKPDARVAASSDKAYTHTALLARTNKSLHHNYTRGRCPNV